MFRKILVPTDGSPASFCAAQAVANLIAERDPKSAEVTLLLVTSPIDPSKTDLDEAVVLDANDRMRSHAETALDKTAAAFAHHCITHKTQILQGDPTSAIIAEEAKRGGYDLIAMGSRGMGLQKDNAHYVGSVTERVIRRVPIPVLVVPVHHDGCED